MISNQILLNTIEGLKAIARIDFCVMDTDGKEVAQLYVSELAPVVYRPVKELKGFVKTEIKSGENVKNRN